MKKIVFLIYLSSLLISCSKDNDDLPIINNNDTIKDSDLLSASVRSSFSDELDINYSSALADSYDSYSSRPTGNTLATCATISIDNANPGEFPKTITVNFGSNCTINGITRAGSLTITITDYVMNYGSTMTIVRGNDYYINGYKAEGTIVYENTTTNPSFPSWNRDLTNGKITTPEGKIYTYTDSRSVQLIQGANTATLTDDVYKATSGSRTINRPNSTYLNSTILTPLIKSYSCAYISEGTLDLQGSFLNGVLDYGNGNCDNQATYTHSNGQVFNVNL